MICFREKKVYIVQRGGEEIFPLAIDGAGGVEERGAWSMERREETRFEGFFSFCCLENFKLRREKRERLKRLGIEDFLVWWGLLLVDTYLQMILLLQLWKKEMLERWSGKFCCCRSWFTTMDL